MGSPPICLLSIITFLRIFLCLQLNIYALSLISHSRVVAADKGARGSKQSIGRISILSKCVIFIDGKYKKAYGIKNRLRESQTRPPRPSTYFRIVGQLKRDSFTGYKLLQTYKTQLNAALCLDTRAKKWKYTFK